MHCGSHPFFAGTATDSCRGVAPLSQTVSQRATSLLSGLVAEGSAARLLCVGMAMAKLELLTPLLRRRLLQMISSFPEAAVWRQDADGVLSPWEQCLV